MLLVLFISRWSWFVFVCFRFRFRFRMKKWNASVKPVEGWCVRVDGGTMEQVFLGRLLLSILYMIFPIILVTYVFFLCLFLVLLVCDVVMGMYSHICNMCSMCFQFTVISILSWVLHIERRKKNYTFFLSVSRIFLAISWDVLFLLLLPLFRGVSLSPVILFVVYFALVSDFRWMSVCMRWLSRLFFFRFRWCVYVL